MDFVKPDLQLLWVTHAMGLQYMEIEDLVSTLESIVERFGEDIAPFAVTLCQQLTFAFWRLQACLPLTACQLCACLWVQHVWAIKRGICALLQSPRWSCRASISTSVLGQVCMTSSFGRWQSFTPC